MKEEKAPAILSNLPVNVRWPPESADSPGDRLLLAVLIGRRKTLKAMNANGISLDTLTSDGQTPLFCAAFLGKKNLVKSLLQLGANPNARCAPEGYTPVHGACFSGRVSILKSLVQSGGDLRLTDTKRRSPVDWTDYQSDVGRRRKMREFIEALRLETLKAPSVCKIPTEVTSSRFAKFMGMGIIHSRKSEFERPSKVSLNGFGPSWTHNGVRFSGSIGLPAVSEVSDLKLESDNDLPSWICGKFCTFIPMVWSRKNTSVTAKSLRYKSVEEAVPDILLAELDTLVTLQHPRILMLLAICQEQNYSSISLVFEKVTFGSLYFFLHNSNLRMRSSFATDLISQISEALDFVHGSGYLHCGISSHAIMLVGENQAKLGCFEYAVPEDDNSKIVAARHPWLASDAHLNVIRHWAAPEVLTQTQKPSRASDVYSLCCVMWELVLGELPWKDHSLESLRQQYLTSPGIRLPLHRSVIPPYWWSTLSVGLKTRVYERDLDLTEIRYMMNLAKNKSVTPSGNDSLRRRIVKSSDFNNLRNRHETRMNTANTLEDQDQLIDLEDHTDAPPPPPQKSSSKSHLIQRLSSIFQPPTEAAVITRTGTSGRSSAKSVNFIDIIEDQAHCGGGDKEGPEQEGERHFDNEAEV